MKFKGVQMKCEYCSKEHDGTYGSGRFCSQKCARGFSSRDKREEINRKVSKIMKGFHRGFKHTEEEIEKMRSSQIKRHMERARNTKFEELTLDMQKKILLEENNHKCSECGQEDVWNGKILIFELHHKDGNHSNKSKENTDLLCPNCHSQTKNYKFRNRKHSKATINKIATVKAQNCSLRIK
jgi:Zn finger protein HypA/HybF involved in hydrogenase expression